MRRRFVTGLALAMVGAAFALDAGGSASEAQGLSNFFRNLLSGSSEDPPPPSPGGFGRVDEAYCPAVDVFPGGAALQAYGGTQGDPHALRHQLSLVDFARECVTQPDGSIRIKVGVEGRALLGPAGSGGRFEAPVRFDIKVGDKVILSRAKRVAVTMTGSQGEFIAIEDNLVVPPNIGEYEIEVGLGGARAAERSQRRRGG